MTVRTRLFLLFAIPGCGAAVASVTGELPDATAPSPDAGAVGDAGESGDGAGDVVQLPDAPPPDGPLLPDGACTYRPAYPPYEHCLDDAGMHRTGAYAMCRGLDDSGFPMPDVPDGGFDDAGCLVIDRVWDTSGGMAVGAPTIKGDKCCYPMCNGGVICGRPLGVGDEFRTAPIVDRADWIAAHAGQPVPDDPALRRALAESFAEDGRMEHASIASFARFTLELLAFGAPPDLIVAAQDAARDEIDHARSMFSLASRFAERPVGPGPLDMRGVAPAATLADAVEAAIREGCVAETIAAVVAEAQADVAEDAESRRVLQKVARDEGRHAELAWRFVAWAFATSPDLATASERIFDDALARTLGAAGAATATSCDDLRMRRFGRLSTRERARAIEDAVSSVIRPCAACLSC